MHSNLNPNAKTLGNCSQPNDAGTRQRALDLSNLGFNRQTQLARGILQSSDPAIGFSMDPSRVSENFSSSGVQDQPEPCISLVCYTFNAGNVLQIDGRCAKDNPVRVQHNFTL